MALRRIAALMLALVLLSSPLLVLADSNISCTYVPITGATFVVDSLHGVDAIYKKTQKLYCYELVQRYYRQIYGISTSTSYGGPKTHSSEYSFIETKNPKPGDVGYSPSYLRAAGYAHWVLVKSYKDGVVTLIEQNWKWNGKAAYERKISIDHDEYFFYTLVGKDPIVDIGLNTASALDPTVPSTWAESYLDLAEQSGISCTGAYLDKITRAEFCSLMIQAAQILKPDLTPMYSAYNYTDTCDVNVILCAQYGFATGTSSSTFSPNDPITREAAATMICRMLKTLNCDLPPSNVEDTSLKSASSWAKESLATLSDANIIVGSCGDLHPKDYLTNEQALVIIMRLLENY